MGCQLVVLLIISPCLADAAIGLESISQRMHLVISDPAIWLEVVADPQVVKVPIIQSFIYPPGDQFIHFWQLVCHSLKQTKLVQFLPHYHYQPPTMSSSSSSSFSSSSSSSSSSPNTTTFPSSAALAAARMRRHRRDAISYQAESEWDAPAAASPTTTMTTSQTPFTTGWSWTDHSSSLPPRATPGVPLAPPSDELICPLSSFPSSSSPPSFSFAFSHVDASPPDDGDVDNELQATLARFAFPSPTRKHRRSGESVDHHPTTPPSAVGGGAIRRCGTGPVKRAQCVHCEHARTSV